jgi:secreted trypsin-like serine protease
MGDSGGGFAIEKNGRWFLRGVVSFGMVKVVKNSDGMNTIACDKKIPSIYLDLTQHLNWIKENALNYTV